MKPCLYLKTDTAQEMKDLFLESGLINEDGTSPEGIDVVEVGIISKDSGRKDEEGFPIMDVEPGYHANIYGDIPAAMKELLDVYAIPAPATPHVSLWV